MLSPPATVRIYLATEHVDLRRGPDGLCALVRGRYSLDPYSGHLFAFVGKRGDRIKILYFDQGGFVVIYKRLEKSRFQLPRVSPGASHVTLDAAALTMLLAGVDLRCVRRTALWQVQRGTA